MRWLFALFGWGVPDPLNTLLPMLPAPKFAVLRRRMLSITNGTHYPPPPNWGALGPAPWTVACLSPGKHDLPAWLTVVPSLIAVGQTVRAFVWRSSGKPRSSDPAFQGHLRSSKLTWSIGYLWLPINVPQQPWVYPAPFPTYSDILAENREFSPPNPYLTPPQSGSS